MMNKEQQQAEALAAMIRQQVQEGTLSEEAVSRFAGVKYCGEGGPVLCCICHTICDFGQRGDGPGEQDPETGRHTCSDACRD